MTKNEITDICIVGGGYVGLATAIAIQTFAPHLNIQVLDGAATDTINNDERAFAITDSAKKMLEVLDIWQNIKQQAAPIKKMIITDSQTNDAIRPIFLTFNEPKDKNPFAYMIANKILIKALRAKANKLNIQQQAQTYVDNFITHDSHIEIKLQNNKNIKTKLLIAADGGRSKLRDLAEIRTIHKNYSQIGIVTTISHQYPHNDCAYEHFLPNGPFATLPLQNNCSCLVWSEDKTLAQKLLQSDNVEFQLELEKRLGNMFGKIKIIGKKNGFPLNLTLARDFIKPRFALVGDAAHAIHPIAGQGLNLGFKDAAALAQTIIQAQRLGQDIGSTNVLENYQQWRRFDSMQMAVVTDTLNQLFSNNSRALRAIRTIGLGLVDKIPFVKQHFINQAAGYENKWLGNSPALLKGEAI